jgi:acyl-CoA thioesterase-2
VDLLDPERVEPLRFRGRSADLGWGRLFGGQVLGQALAAAQGTVPADRPVHSLQSYFLRAGDVQRPITYEVDPIRDGRSFATRRVVAFQGDEAIFSLSASFHRAEAGFEHQEPMPEVPAPEGLPTEAEVRAQVAHRLGRAARDVPEGDPPIDLRLVRPPDPVLPEQGPPIRQLWYRAAAALPDDPALHQRLLAFTSDFYFLGTAMLPHGVTWQTPGMHAASLDHTIWFHRPVRFDDWLLYDMRSPAAAGARGLVWGRIFDRHGVLVATTAQEGLMRLGTPA